MNATTPGKGQKQREQEDLLREYVERLGKHAEEYIAVHLHLSGLQPVNRKEQHMRAATGNFDRLVSDMFGQMFVLNNQDVIFIFKSQAVAQVESIVQRIRFMFSDDPMFDDADKHEEDPFATWYDLAVEYDMFHAVVTSLARVERAQTPSTTGRSGVRAALKARQEKGDPLTPDILGRAEKALARTDLSNLLRRQYICKVNRKMVPEPVFSELYISIADLREVMLPGIDLTSDRWLFQHLTESLDKRMLALLTKTDRFTISGDISFNVNVATLLSTEFAAFDENISAARRGSMVLELQKLDIFADLGAFFFAREFVQEKGYRILLDGMTYQTLSMIDRERLGVDLVKVFWHPELVDGGPAQHEELREMVETAGSNRVIMCRCDNREAIDFGRSVGVSLFQGHFVEDLIAKDDHRRDMLKLKRRIERGTQGA